MVSVYAILRRFKKHPIVRKKDLSLNTPTAGGNITPEKYLGKTQFYKAIIDLWHTLDRLITSKQDLKNDDIKKDLTNLVSFFNQEQAKLGLNPLELPKIKSHPNLFNFWKNTVKPTVKLWIDKHNYHYAFNQSADKRPDNIVKYYELFNAKHNPRNEYLWYLGNEYLTSKNPFADKNQKFYCSTFLYEKRDSNHYIAIDVKTDILYKYYPDSKSFNYFGQVDSSIETAIENLLKNPK